ncbi:hypothetical protein CTI12_AA013490 [Artemisia annua]|uniref:N-acetyltransferase domain-containing protein n=1 Tax=Artemisia annua TaxID=35608 RepID=A0A2U1QLX6_ARTAN|nr:hypothetical protein CTI12_AA013490 [Artemisia annua]
MYLRHYRRHVDFWRYQAQALDFHTHHYKHTLHQIKDGRNYIIRAAGLEDYESVIKLQVEELRQDVSVTKLLLDAQVLADRCRGGYQCLVAVGKSTDDKVKEEVLYGTIGLELGLNVPKKFDATPLEEKWQSDLTADAYVDCLVVRAWARRNGIATNLMECAKRLAVEKGMKGIFMHASQEQNLRNMAHMACWV